MGREKQKGGKESKKSKKARKGEGHYKDQDPPYINGGKKKN